MPDEYGRETDAERRQREFAGKVDWFIEKVLPVAAPIAIGLAVVGLIIYASKD